MPVTRLQTVHGPAGIRRRRIQTVVACQILKCVRLSMFPSCVNETEVRKSRVGFTPCLRARCVTDQFDMDSAAPIILNKVCYQLFRISFPIIRLRTCLLDTTDIRVRRISFHVGATRAKSSCVKLSKYANDKRRVRCSKSCGKQASSVGHSSELRWNNTTRAGGDGNSESVIPTN